MLYTGREKNRNTKRGVCNHAGSRPIFRRGGAIVRIVDRDREQRRSKERTLTGREKGKETATGMRTRNTQKKSLERKECHREYRSIEEEKTEGSRENIKGKRETLEQM